MLGRDKSSLSRYVHEGRLKYAVKLEGRNGVFLFRRADVAKLRDELGAGEVAS